jgi:hypothetical protein
MEYCDYIAHLISKMLFAADAVSDGLLASVDSPKLDLDADGVFQSTDKFIHVTDLKGNTYLITVEAI